MKPNTRILDYVVLVQDDVLTVDDAPQDIKAEVTKWLRYFAGIKDDDGMVKDDTTTATSNVPAKASEPVTDNGGASNVTKSTI